MSNETTSTRAGEAQTEHTKTEPPHLHAPYLVLGPWDRLCVSLYVSLYVSLCVSLCELLLLHCGAACNHHLRFNTRMPDGLTALSLWSLAPSLLSLALWQWMAHNLDSECFGLYKTCAHPHNSAVLLDMVMREGETSCQITDQLRENNCTQVQSPVLV